MDGWFILLLLAVFILSRIIYPFSSTFYLIVDWLFNLLPNNLLKSKLSRIFFALALLMFYYYKLSFWDFGGLSYVFALLELIPLQFSSFNNLIYFFNSSSYWVSLLACTSIGFFWFLLGFSILIYSFNTGSWFGTRFYLIESC